MAWTAPALQADRYLVGSTGWNNKAVNNILFLKDKLDRIGDVAYLYATVGTTFIINTYTIIAWDVVSDPNGIIAATSGSPNYEFRLNTGTYRIKATALIGITDNTGSVKHVGFSLYNVTESSRDLIGGVVSNNQPGADVNLTWKGHNTHIIGELSPDNVQGYEDYRFEAYSLDTGGTGLYAAGVTPAGGYTAANNNAVFACQITRLEG